MQKKTSLDRQQVLDLFIDVDPRIVQNLLKYHHFSYTQIPSGEEIVSILNSVEKSYPSKRGTWTPCQDRLLNLLVLGHSIKQQTIPVHFSTNQWDQISRMFRYHNWKACRNRWLQERNQKAPWTSEEDKVLVELQMRNPNKWCDIAIELMRICQTPYIRQGKQCRDRWVNKLDPNIIHHPWTVEEEVKLFKEIRDCGKKWADISQRVFQLKRTENTIKNRFYNLIKQEENKVKLGRMPKEEKERILLDSIISSLEAGLKQRNQVQKQDETESQLQQFKIKLFESPIIFDKYSIILFQGRKLIKLE